MTKGTRRKLRLNDLAKWRENINQRVQKMSNSEYEKSFNDLSFLAIDPITTTVILGTKRRLEFSRSTVIPKSPSGNITNR